MVSILLENGDQRILGDGDFVKAVLESCRQQVERRYQYLA
jgi:hypothetical protein